MKKKEYVKIWNELLTDVKFQNLTLAQQAQFLNLLIFVNMYGAGGALIITPPAPLLLSALRCKDYPSIIQTLKKISEVFKGFSCSCNDGYLVIAFKNWHKYQVDNSVERVRKHRYLAVTKVTTYEDFITTLKANEAYKGIDIDNQLLKMDAWLSTPAAIGRKKTHRFILNWLNKAEKTFDKVKSWRD